MAIDHLRALELAGRQPDELDALVLVEQVLDDGDIGIAKHEGEADLAVVRKRARARGQADRVGGIRHQRGRGLFADPRRHGPDHRHRRAGERGVETVLGHDPDQVLVPAPACNVLGEPVLPLRSQLRLHPCNVHRRALPCRAVDVQV